jgi:hypothetical protein
MGGVRLAWGLRHPNTLHLHGLVVTGGETPISMESAGGKDLSGVMRAWSIKGLHANAALTSRVCREVPRAIRQPPRGPTGGLDLGTTTLPFTRKAPPWAAATLCRGVGPVSCLHP